MKLQNFKKVDKGVLKYSFDIHFENFGLTVRSCCFMDNGTNQWIQFPQRSYEENGEKKYFNYLFWEKERLLELTRQVKNMIPEMLVQSEVRTDPWARQDKMFNDQDIPF